MTLSTKLSWSDIKTLYPHQNVALTDVERQHLRYITRKKYARISWNNA